MGTTSESHFVESTGTWDEWLIKRPRPAVSPGAELPRLTDADLAIRLLQLDRLEFVDFGLAELRNGLRALFEEFERDTAGQAIRLKRPPEPGSRTYLEIGRNDEALVLTVTKANDGLPVDSIAVELSPDDALIAVQQILSAVRDGRP